MTMPVQLLIAHAPGEEDIAEQLALSIRQHGYEVDHRGTFYIGDSLIGEVSHHLSARNPILLCGTSRAAGSKWTRMLVSAARSSPGVKVFALQMEGDAELSHLTLDEKYGLYYSDPVKAINDLLDALRHYYPSAGILTDQPDQGELLKEALSRYYVELQRRYQRLDIDTLSPRQRMENMEVLLSSIYIEQKVRDDPPPIELPKELIERLRGNIEWEQAHLPGGIALEDVRRVSDVYYKKPSRAVLDVLMDPHYPCIVILGDPGSGKSTLTRYIVLSLIGQTTDSTRLARAFPNFLPLLIELKSYGAFLKKSADHRDFLDYCDHLYRTEGSCIKKELLHKYLSETAKAIIIFDGLDEIFDPEEREKMCRYINKFKETYRAPKIIITSRIVGFQPKVLLEGGFRIYTLQDLEEQQIEEFVVKWYDIAFRNKPDEARSRVGLIMEAIRESSSIRQLAGNPLLLTIMAILARVQELPRERWKLYDHAASVLIEIWDVSRYLKNEEVIDYYIDEDDKKEMLQRIAVKMQRGEEGTAGNYILDKELQREFELYLTDRYQTPAIKAKQAAVKMIQQLHERNFILLLYGARLYGFVHRAFLEFFCAKSIVYEFQSTHQLTLDQLKTAVYGRYQKDQSWHEVLRLVAGMIQPQFTGDIIQWICRDHPHPPVNQTEEGGSSYEISPPPMGLALGIKCLAEIKRVNLLADPAKNLLTSLCNAFFSDMDIGPPRLFSFFRQHILPFAKSIGPSWPEREALAVVLMELTDTFRYSYIYDEVFGSFVGFIGKGSPEVHHVLINWLNYKNNTLRVLTPFALATGWHDHPDTFDILYGLAVGDLNNTVCYAAIYALAEHFADDPRIFSLIQGLSTSSPHDFGRAAAVNALAAKYSDKPGVLDILINISTKELHKFPRTAAVKALGIYFFDRPGTREVLFRIAQSDRSPKPIDSQYEDLYYPRDAAISSIVDHWPYDPDTSSLLRDRIENDQTPWLQRKCEKLLYQITAIAALSPAL